MEGKFALALTHNGQVTSRNLGLGVKFNIICPIQLRVPAELHAAGAVGDRVRDDGGQHPADHPTEQEPLPGPPTGVARGIVSTHILIFISSHSELHICQCEIESSCPSVLGIHRFIPTS